MEHKMILITIRTPYTKLYPHRKTERSNNQTLSKPPKGCFYLIMRIVRVIQWRPYYE